MTTATVAPVDEIVEVWHQYKKDPSSRDVTQSARRTLSAAGEI